MRFPIRLKGKVPATIATHELQGLTACSLGSQNCVSSLNPEPSLAIAGLTFQDSPEAAIKRLKTIVLGLGQTRLAKQSADYLWFECESEFFGFIDDLEFRVLPEQQAIQVRSAARLGVKDFGVNRRRLERIRQMWLPCTK